MLSIRKKTEKSMDWDRACFPSLQAMDMVLLLAVILQKASLLVVVSSLLKKKGSNHFSS